MTFLHFFVLLNNMVCILACATCFFYGLHSGLYTNLLTKMILYTVGFGLYSGVIDSTTLLMPGHKYIIAMNILFGASMIAVFVIASNRAGYLSQWKLSLQHLLHLFGGVKHEGRNNR